MRSARFFSWEKFHSIATKGLKVFFFYLAVLSFFRLFFIFWMQDYMGPAAGEGDVMAALWRGMKLSCQTAGILALGTFLPAASLGILRRKAGELAGMVLSGGVLTVLSILFVASFPYYRQFHSNFNQLVFHAANDD